MKVALLTDAIHYPLTGIGRYCWELAQGLKEEVDRAADFEPIFIRHTGRCSFAALSRIAGDPGGGERQASTRTRFPLELLAALRRHAGQNAVAASLYRRWSNFRVRQLLEKDKPKVLHGPNFTLPPGLEKGIATVVTVHDLSVWVNPNWHPSERVRYMRATVPGSLERADRIVTISKSTAQDLWQHFPKTKSKTVVIPLGVSRHWLQTPFPTERRGTICVSTIEPRKNIETLLAAYQRLPARLREEHPLTLIGALGWRYEETLALIRNAQREGWLRYLRYVPEADLPALVARARLSVYPSLYEGFGLPVLEALAVGTPVIAGAHSSIPEVAPEHLATLLPHVAAPDSLAEAILAELTRPWSDAAARRRRAHAQGRAWASCVQATLHLYRDLSG
ncbi:MAG: glycosyltransferase family 4 protein [Casimicrobiaceae bacterium]|nr:glycosyltransferase family 4 protein [Casimicrobiaceae bacterium]MDW8313205.1 glycosyltransferase family 1 protein [Burkholderiales bacterium]